MPLPWKIGTWGLELDDLKVLSNPNHPMGVSQIPVPISLTFHSSVLTVALLPEIAQPFGYKYIKLKPLLCQHWTSSCMKDACV